MTLNVVGAAAREGARIGAVNNTCGTPPCTFDNTLALQRITDVLAGANLTASTTPTVECVPVPPAVDCGPDAAVRARVTVNFSTIFPLWPWPLPGMPGPIALTNVAVSRFE